jgi:hypothetical protein
MSTTRSTSLRNVLMNETLQNSLLVFPTQPRRSRLQPVVHPTGLLFILLQLSEENFVKICVLLFNNPEGRRFRPLHAGSLKSRTKLCYVATVATRDSKIITASSQMPYRVILTPFLNDTLHMRCVPSPSLMYPSRQFSGVVTRLITYLTAR